MVEPICWDLRAVSTECVDGVCCRDYRTIIIKSWSIPKRDLQSKYQPLRKGFKG